MDGHVFDKRNRIQNEMRGREFFFHLCPVSFWFSPLIFIPFYPEYLTPSKTDNTDFALFMSKREMCQARMERIFKIPSHPWGSLRALILIHSAFSATVFCHGNTTTLITVYHCCFKIRLNYLYFVQWIAKKTALVKSNVIYVFFIKVESLYALQHI